MVARKFWLVAEAAPRLLLPRRDLHVTQLHGLLYKRLTGRELCSMASPGRPP